METKNCLQCNILFHRKSNISWIEWESRTKFCSKPCADLYKKGKPFKHSKQFQKGQKAWNAGLTKETSSVILKNAQEYWQGENNPMKKISARQKSSLSHMGQNLDEAHPNWKGDEVGYAALHDYIRSRLGTPDTCEHCGKSGLYGQQIHWANKKPYNYSRDLSDWLRLCASCHAKYDRTENLIYH